jgi:hypothetical protein
MKKVVFIIFLPLIFCLHGHAQEKNRADMVKKIFQVLQDKDEEGFVKLFPDAATIKIFLTALYGKDSSVENDNRRNVNTMTYQLPDSVLQIKYRESFMEAIEIGEKKGIDWDKTSYVSYVADSTFNKQTKMFILSGKIYFNTDEKEYFLSFDEIAWFKNLGWYGVDIDRIDEKSKENDQEVFEWDGMAESRGLTIDTTPTILRVDTVINRSEIKKLSEKSKNKTKQPEKDKPAKIKIQTLALKPEL